MASYSQRSTTGQRGQSGYACLADVAAVQQQPVMRVEQVFGRHAAQQLLLDLARVRAPGEPEPMGDAEDVRVDRHRRLAERAVQHDVGGLAPDARQLLQRLAIARHLAAVLLEQDPAGGEDVLHLGRVQADRPDVGGEPFLAEREERLRRAGHRKQLARREVDAFVGGLRGEDHGDQQFERRREFEFGDRASG